MTTLNAYAQSASQPTKKAARKSLKSVALVSSALMLAGLSGQSQALEAGLQFHKGEESGSVGYHFSLADRFSRKSPYGWQVSYNHLSELGITWNDTELFFDSNTIELMGTYSYEPRSYNKFIKRLVFEFQAGASVQLTENKFVWEELELDRTFSEKGDVSGVLAFITHYKISRESKFHIGAKIYPKFSEFDSVGTVFAGFTYKFGSKTGY